MPVDNESYMATDAPRRVGNCFECGADLTVVCLRCNPLAKEPPPPPPAGDMVLVPREPTEAMIEAAKSAMAEWRKTLDPDERMLRHTIRNGRAFHSADEDEKVVIRWRAMLTAAPLPAQEVSDAMVERALTAYWASDLSWDDPRHRQEGKDAERRDMRFALEAALHPAKD